MQDEPKRLTPTKDVLRELYLKSGNQCAFPVCEDIIIDKLGNFVGQIVHIKAVMPGEPRFDPNQTNEERRAFSNLMLMCYKHHITTNDEQIYTVEKLHKLKAEHESKFTDIASVIQKNIVDYTKSDIPENPISLERFSNVLELRIGDDDLEWKKEVIKELASRLKKIPKRARQLLLVMVERGEIDQLHCNGLVMPADELIECCRLTENDYRGLMAILERYDLAYESGENFDHVFEVKVSGVNRNWLFWDELKQFTETTQLSLEQIIIDLRFTLLD